MFEVSRALVDLRALNANAVKGQIMIISSSVLIAASTFIISRAPIAFRALMRNIKGAISFQGV